MVRRFYRSMFAALCVRLQHEYEEVVVDVVGDAAVPADDDVYDLVEVAEPPMDTEDAAETRMDPEDAAVASMEDRMDYDAIRVLTRDDYDRLNRAKMQEQLWLKRYEFDAAYRPYLHADNVAEVFDMVAMQRDKKAKHILQRVVFEKVGVHSTLWQMAATHAGVFGFRRAAVGHHGAVV